ncbi:MAG: radical SAM protein [Leptospiraceae bacterium]|nr:radical SAM protein [Leptospiraceae bacterium]MCP5493210.1 radical SAM protein [Leptospiraceae bacterium]
MISKVYYQTVSLCPYCNKTIPGQVVAKDGGVYVVRDCEEHGLIEGLASSDIEWFENLKKFDVEPVRPSQPNREVSLGCPNDCGLCAGHTQSAGTAAIEISNKCNANCPVCLANNQSTFELSVNEVRKIVEDFLAKQKFVDAFTLSGGEPTIHPEIFEIIELLERPEIARIVLNSNGLRIAEDDAFLEELSKHKNVYVSLHYDGTGAKTIRGIDFAIQKKAMDRLLKWNIQVAPIALVAKDINDMEVGNMVVELLTKSPQIKSVFLSMMAYMGKGGSKFPVDPRARLTIPEALDKIEKATSGNIKKSDFIPLPMPNPLCASIGYFLIADNEVTPLVSLLEVDKVIECIKNSHFARAGKELEELLRDLINRLYADGSNPNSAKILKKFKNLLLELYPTNKSISHEERRMIVEEKIKTVYLIQFMDSWTFDSVRLKKCSCQHLLPDDKIIPSCGYYTYHRQFDTRFN